MGRFERGLGRLGGGGAGRPPAAAGTDVRRPGDSHPTALPGPSYTGEVAARLGLAAWGLDWDDEQPLTLDELVGMTGLRPVHCAACDGAL